MSTVEFVANNIGKEFNRRRIFDAISFSLRERTCLSITGRNGSGKSTLAKILCGLLTPTRGDFVMRIDGVKVAPHDLFTRIGFVAPYLNLYDEFTGIENLSLFSRIRILGDTSARTSMLLQRFGIYDRRNDDVRAYSSGMKQRLKYAAALLHQPSLLILDEPSSNLDEEGISVVRTVMEEQKKRGILIIATNDKDDLAVSDLTIALDKPPVR